jgi:RecA-family ATPase
MDKQSIMMTCGPPKAYKSIIATTMCYHLVTGTPLFNVTKAVREKEREPFFTVSGAQKVLILEQEMGEYSLQERFRHMVSEMKPPERTLFEEKIFVHSCDLEAKLDTPGGRDHISFIIYRCAPDVVIFDPLIEFHGGNENQAQDMMRVMGGVDYLRQRHGFASDIIHHMSKPQKDSGRHGPDNMRGSSVLYGKGDSFLMCVPERRRKGIVKVSFTIRRGKPISSLYLRINERTLLAEFDSWVEGA